jgi:hypothetical protein
MPKTDHGLYVNTQLAQQLNAAVEAVEVLEAPIWGDDLASDVDAQWQDSKLVGRSRLLNAGGLAPAHAALGYSYLRTAPRLERVGTSTGEYGHLKHKTIPWNWLTRITPLATNTTLATATRHDTAPITIYMPETAERVIESARLIITFRTEHPAGTINVTNTRVGFQLGAGPTVDYDRPFTTGTTATRNLLGMVDQDVTEYMKRWVSGTSMSAVASLAVAEGSIAAVNNITFKLLLTYAHAPTTGTRLKCIRIPIQSSITALTITQQELGTDGTSPAPSGQIPALDTFLPELSKVYRQATLCIWGNDGATVGTNFTPQLQIDALAEIPRATIDATEGTQVIYYDQVDIAPLISPAATHTVNMRGDTVTTARMYWVGAILEVVYEYDHASTLANNLAIYEALVPLTMSDGISPGSPIYDNAGSSALTLQNYQCVVASLDVHEPAPVTLVQSAVFAITNVSSSGALSHKLAGNQPARVYTPISSMGPTPIIHRVDINNGWSLQRGRNRLPFFLGNSAGRTTTQTSYAIINYTAGVLGDVDNGMHPVNYNIDQQQPANTVGSIDLTPQNAATRLVQLGSTFRIASALIEVWMHQNLQGAYGIEQQAGERDGSAFFGSNLTLVQTGVVGDVKTTAMPVIFAMTNVLNRDSLHSGNIDIRKPRRQILESNTNQMTAMFSWWVSYHQHAYPISGTVTVNGANAPAGATVEIWANDPSNFLLPVDLVTKATVGAAGAFSATVPDDVRTYFCAYHNGSNHGVSQVAAPSSGFNITIGAVSTDVQVDYSAMGLLASDPNPLIPFTIGSGNAEYSLDGAGFVGIFSPVSLPGLADGFHTLIIRSISNPASLQTLSWTLDSTPAGPSDGTPPTITVISPPPGSVIGQGTPLVFRYSDETGLRRPLPCAKFQQPDGSFKYELIHDGDSFTADYQGSKTIVQASPPIWEYKVTRRGGWGATIPYLGGSPTLVPFGTDTGGNEPA